MLGSFPCPYCNAKNTPPTTRPIGGRITCAFCSESFPLPAGLFLDDDGPEPTHTAPSPAPTLQGAAEQDARRIAQRRSLRRSAWIIGGMVLLGIVIGIGIRQMRDEPTGPPPPPPRDPATVTIPSELAALRRLPKNGTIIVGVHLAQIVEAGRAVGDPTGRASLERAGFPVDVLDGITLTTGLRSDDIDHLVLSGSTQNGLLGLLGSTILVRTRMPIDSTILTKDALAEPLPPENGRNYIRCSPAALQGFPVTVWFIDDRTLAIAADKSSLNALPSTPHPDLNHLSEDLRDLLKAERLPSGTTVWLAASGKDWDKLLQPSLLPSGRLTRNLPKLDTKLLAPLEGFALGLATREPPPGQLTLWLRLKNAESAEPLRRLLTERVQGEKKLGIVGGSGEWLLVRVKAKSEVLSELFRSEPKSEKKDERSP